MPTLKTVLVILGVIIAIPGALVGSYQCNEYRDREKIAIVNPASARENPWFVFSLAGKELSTVREMAVNREKVTGDNVGIVVSSDYPGLNQETWYCLSHGAYADSVAAFDHHARLVRQGLAQAYVKNVITGEQIAK